MSPNQEPLVSICCLTYNHERYLQQALDGFISQKTDFPFEVIIHDDASTDDTVKIIHEYEKQYPDIIRSICEPENLYSKNIEVTNILFQRALGKYIAFCEGDDYWTDPYKLQAQIDFFKKHPECSICGHAVKIYNQEKQKFGEINPKYKMPELLDFYDFLRTGGSYLSSLSIIFKKEFIEKVPAIYYKVPYTDFLIKVLCAQKGKVGFLNKVMGVYRHHNQSLSQKNPINFIEKTMKNLDLISEYLYNDKKARIILLKRKIYYSMYLMAYGQKMRRFLHVLTFARNFQEYIYTYVVIIDIFFHKIIQILRITRE